MTFGDLETTVEAYILDFEQDIYGKTVTMDLFFCMQFFYNFNIKFL